MRKGDLLRFEFTPEAARRWNGVFNAGLWPPGTGSLRLRDGAMALAGELETDRVVGCVILLHLPGGERSKWSVPHEWWHIVKEAEDAN